MDNKEYLEKYSRETLMDLCIKNDPNGVYSDEDSEAEGYDPLTKEDFIDIISRWMKDEDITSADEFVSTVNNGKRNQTNEGINMGKTFQDYLEMAQQNRNLEIPNLYALFTKVNKDTEGTAEYVPITDAEYYATQIQNLYDTSDEESDRLGKELIVYAAQQNEGDMIDEHSNIIMDKYEGEVEKDIYPYEPYTHMYQGTDKLGNDAIWGFDQDGDVDYLGTPEDDNEARLNL